MKLKNLSSNSWLEYHCGGGVYIDIPAKAVFEVKDESIARFILRKLGSPVWVIDLAKPKNQLVQEAIEFGLTDLQIEEIYKEDKEEKVVEAKIIKKEIKKEKK